MRSLYIIFFSFFLFHSYGQDINEINSKNVIGYSASFLNSNSIQYGNNNSIELLLTNSIKNISIIQEGENNLFNYFDYINRNISIDNEIVMKGVNNTVTIYGTNSISQNMDIEIQGSHKVITIINK